MGVAGSGSGGRRDRGPPVGSSGSKRKTAWDGGDPDHGGGAAYGGLPSGGGWEVKEGKSYSPLVAARCRCFAQEEINDSCTASTELIQLDPPELSFPCLNKNSLSSVDIVNITDCYVGFSIFSTREFSACYETEPSRGILPPRSTQRMLVQHEPEEDMRCMKNIFVWNMIVDQGVESSILTYHINRKDSKELPFIFNNNISPCTSTSNELIRFDHPGLPLPFSQNQTWLFSINMVNVTDYHVGFRPFMADEEDVAVYYRTDAVFGILATRSAQRLLIARQIDEEEPQDTPYKDDNLFIWNAIVSECVKVSDLDCSMSLKPEESLELPITINKLTSPTSVELIKFEPLEVCFPFLPSKRLSSSIKIVNITDYHIGFKTQVGETNVALYITEPQCGILPPWSTQELLVTRVANEEAPELEDICFVAEDVNVSDLTRYMNEEESKELPIVFTETSSSILDELIQFDPPELHFPILPNKKVLSSIKIVNLTDYNVGFNTYSRPTSAAPYHTEPSRGILTPRSTQKLMVTREEKEDTLEDKQLNEKYFVWTSILSEGVKDGELSDYMDDQESKELPIVLDKISSLTSSDELIQLDPAELCMPHWPNKEMKFIVNIVNTTDFYVAFNVYTISRNASRDKEPAGRASKGILPPRSTKRQILNWIIDETEEPVEDYFVWSRVVTEGVESRDIIGYMVEEESKKLPFIILNKASPACSSKELIQFEPPELSLPLMMMPNKPLLFSVNIVNSTDYYVGFDKYNPQTNVAWYYTKPAGGVMPPRATQRLVVLRVPKKKEELLSECQDDKFLVWSCLVNEGAKASNFYDYTKYEGSKELPIVYTTNKTSSLCTSDELIQFDHPQLPFIFLPNMRVPMLRLLKIVNVTDHIVGFSTWSHEANSASYTMEPRAGILPPQSTQAIKVRRTPKKNLTEDMQCKDKIFVWNGIVTEGVQVSDVQIYWKDDDKELPIVLTKGRAGKAIVIDLFVGF
uniref:MSP domain-containing protein n=1 Tax=Triticum aestivum TaxID=4565 RepID=A0A080YUR9_WHEAT|nr:unnamed protein product [Triticum aestivum]